MGSLTGWLRKTCCAALQIATISEFLKQIDLGTFGFVPIANKRWIHSSMSRFQPIDRREVAVNWFWEWIVLFVGLWTTGSAGSLLSLELIRIELTEVAVAVDSSLSGISVLTTLGLALFLLLELTFPILFLLENYKKKRIKKKKSEKKKKNDIFITSRVWEEQFHIHFFFFGMCLIYLLFLWLMKRKGIKWIYAFYYEFIYPNKTRSAATFLLALLKHHGSFRLIVIVH